MADLKNYLGTVAPTFSLGYIPDEILTILSKKMPHRKEFHLIVQCAWYQIKTATTQFLYGFTARAVEPA